MNKDTFYLYDAKITKIIDGDTIDAQIDLGFHMQANLRFRLAGIDTPELRIKDQYADALKAKQYIENMILGARCVIESSKGDKYGRWLATVYLPDGSSVNEKLLQEGLAKPYMV